MTNNYPVRRSSKQRRRKEIKAKIVNTIVGILILCSLIGLGGIEGYIKTHYNREGVIVKCEDNVITVRDKVGFEWQFIGEGFDVDDIVVLKMYNSHTDNTIEDDIIKDVVRK